MRRVLLLAARGGAGFRSPLSYLSSGPYDPGFSPGATVLTQLHCHTTQSDGTYTPAEVVADYASKGYGALQISDHDKVTAQPAGIATAITGNELSPTQQHIISTHSSYVRGSVTSAQTICTGIAAAGGVAHVAHPNWLRGMSFAEMSVLTDYVGFEIHNTHCVNGAGQNPLTYPGYAVGLWDQLLTAGRRDLFGFAVDDLHAISAYDTFDMGRIQAFASSNTAANVAAAVAAGNFVADVANYGVTPGYPDRDDVGVALTCTGAVRIEAYGDSGALLSADDSDTLTHAFSGEQYVRLVAIGDYTEAFGSALTDRWIAVGGSWSVGSGILSVADTGASIGRQILRRHREGDFTLEVDMRMNGSGGIGAGVIFNVLNANYQYLVRLGKPGSPTGYENTLALAKATSGSFGAPMASTPVTVTSNVWYRLVLDYTADTGRLRAKTWKRDTESDPGVWGIDHSDLTWRHGLFGLRGNGAIDYDNLHISGFQTFYQPIMVDVA